MAETKVEVKKAAPAVRAAPPDVWRSFRSEMDRVFDRFSGSFGFPSLRRMFEMEPFRPFETSFTVTAPAVDMSEDEKAYKITAELPGIEAKDVELTMSDGMLVLRGEKREEKEEKEKNYYLSERRFGSFQRAFQLPEGIDRDKVAADFTKGVLTITLPKTTEAQKKTKKITVKSA
jgi:HSP20 family protein